MVAICISNHEQLKKEYEVFKYENWYVMKTESKQLPYRVFAKTDLKKEEIDSGYHYSYYYIDGVIYDTTLTNDYKAIIPKSKGYVQLQLEI